MTFGEALLFIGVFLGIILVAVTLFFIKFTKQPQRTSGGWHEHQPQSKHRQLIIIESAFFCFILLGICFLIHLMSQATLQDSSAAPWMVLVYCLFAGLGLCIFWVLYHVYRLYRAYDAYEKDSKLLINYQEHRLRYVRAEKTYELEKGGIKSLTYYCFTSVWRRSPLTEFERYVFVLENGEQVVITNWVLDITSHALDDVLNITPNKTVTGLKGIYLES